MAATNLVNALWLGNKKLSPLEMLTLKSFTHFGNEFHLWHYEPIQANLPEGVVLRDGNEILAKERIFRYPERMMLGFGQNSYVGFSEIFRYKVLHDVGGWWSDMDVTLLKPLTDVEDEYYFRNHGVLSVVGNIMKVPKGSELMGICYERACVEVNEKQDDWHHAIRILCYHIENLGLNKYIHRHECNLDRIDFILPYIFEQKSIDEVPRNWRFIHWMNSVIPKNYRAGSIMEQFMNKYDCTERMLFI